MNRANLLGWLILIVAVSATIFLTYQGGYSTGYAKGLAARPEPQYENRTVTVRTDTTEVNQLLGQGWEVVSASPTNEGIANLVVLRRLKA